MLLLFEILFFLCVGILCGSIFKPLIYFALFSKGIFNNYKRKYDVYHFHMQWVVVSCIAIVAIIFILWGDSNIFFTIGCVLGIIFSFGYYFYYFKTANGRAALLIAKIKLVKKKIKQLKDYDLTNYQKRQIEDLEDDIQNMQNEIADIYIKDFRKDISSVRKKAGLK